MRGDAQNSPPRRRRNHPDWLPERASAARRFYLDGTERDGTETGRFGATVIAARRGPRCTTRRAGPRCSTHRGRCRDEDR